MPKHNKGDVVFIIESTVCKANIGREVRLMEWIEPNASLNYHDQLIFIGGESGGWIVTPVDGKSLVARGDGDVLRICNLALIKDENVVKTDVSKGVWACAMSDAEMSDMLTAIDNAETYMLSPDEFKAFEDMLEANPLSGNKALQTLLSKPSPWN